jgi:hypothetical protein
MATLINRIQRAMLGSAGPEKVRALLAELAIPTSGSGNPDMEEVRRGFLRPISDEAILRNALANFNLTGGGSGDGRQAIGDIRTAIFHSFDAAGTRLGQGLNDLLEPADLAGGGGGSGLDWVPEGAVIHIDFLGGTPQGRAWTAADGEVSVDTLLGSDPNTSGGWTDSEYDPADLTPDGLVYDPSGGNPPAYIGAARTLITSTEGFTIRIVTKNMVDVAMEVPPHPLALLAADGNDAIFIDFLLDAPRLLGASQGGSLSVTSLDCFNAAIGDVNVAAITIAGSRYEQAANGSAVATGVIDSADRPPENPLVAALTDADKNALQSITIYDPLPDTTGLSELSELAEGGGGAFASGSSVSSRSISGGAI